MNVNDGQRVMEYGEVFTPKREVNTMLDLLGDADICIDTRYLEPACGDGNFLNEILSRKLEITKYKYNKRQLDFEYYAFLAVSSIYGIDILADNVIKCRDRLLELVIEVYQSIYESNVKLNFIDAIEYVLSQNILWGDFLSLEKPDHSAPIRLSEWTFIAGSMIERSDYFFNSLLAPAIENSCEASCFSKPVKKYKPVHFLKLGDVFGISTNV